MNRTLSISALALGALLMTSCGKSINCNDSEQGTIIDYTGLDGCGMLIELSNGNRIEPINLYQFNDVNIADNQKVWVNYQSTSGGSICMAGEIVEITCLENR